MRATVKWDFRDLEAGLRRLREETSSATARNAARRGLLEAGQPMVDRMQELAPKWQRRLASSIAISPNLEKKVGDAEYAQVMREGGGEAAATAALIAARRAAKGSGPMAVTVYVGPAGRFGKAAHLVEFGTKPHTIKAKNADQLSWPETGLGPGGFAGSEVRHPGAAPHPFLRPGFEETADTVMGRIVPMIEAQIGAAAARAARKRARAARG